MKTLPSLRKQVSALIRSIKGLFNVLIFLTFFFAITAIFGLQWFSGSMYYTCRVGEKPIEGAKIWPKLS
jgi:hypothetical protein